MVIDCNVVDVKDAAFCFPIFPSRVGGRSGVQAMMGGGRRKDRGAMTAVMSTRGRLFLLYTRPSTLTNMSAHAALRAGRGVLSD
jgi:hypothetical protein